MERSTRQLIYVTREANAQLSAQFHLRGWHVEVVTNARDARRCGRGRLPGRAGCRSIKPIRPSSSGSSA
jgi:hypothetical protein